MGMPIIVVPPRRLYFEYIQHSLLDEIESLEAILMNDVKIIKNLET